MAATVKHTRAAPSEKAVDDEPPVHVIVAGITDTIGRTAETMSRVEERLGPVLRYRDDDRLDSVAEVAGVSPLADTLDTIHNDIDGLRLRLVALLDRLTV